MPEKHQHPPKYDKFMNQFLAPITPATLLGSIASGIVPYGAL